MATALKSRCKSSWRKVPNGRTSESTTTNTLPKRTSTILKPITGPGSTAFSSVASVFEFHHHLGTDPTNELLVLKRILSRECTLSRLEVACHELRQQYRTPAGADGASGSLGESTAQVIDILSQVRDATVAVVEAVVTWRQDVAKDPPLAFMWQGENYLLKTTDDLNFLAGVEPLVAAMKMHPARFCRNPLMLPCTLDEQLKDVERYDADSQEQSPRVQRRKYLYDIAKVLLDEESTERRVKREVNITITDPREQEDDSEPQATQERHPVLLEKPEGEECYADGNLEVRKTLQQDQLSSWYEEARLQLVSLSSSPEDEEYFLSSRRFWSKEELGTTKAPAPAFHQSRHPRPLKHVSPACGSVSLSRRDPESRNRRIERQELGVSNRDSSSRRIRFPRGGKDGMLHGAHPVGQECPAFAILSTSRRRPLHEPYWRVKRKFGKGTAERSLWETGKARVGDWTHGVGTGRIKVSGSKGALKCHEARKSLVEDASGPLSSVSPADIERLLREAEPPSATTVVCAAVAFLLAPEGNIPEGFSWPKGFEALARPADVFLGRMRGISGRTVSPSKAQTLRSVLQSEELLPVALDQQIGHTVASLCAWVLEQLRGCEEFADWSRAALGSWYDRPSLVKTEAASPERCQMPEPGLRQLHRSLRTLPNGQGSFVITLFEELDSGRLLIRAFDRAKRETFWLPLSRKQMDSLGGNMAASPVNLVAALARKMTLKVDNSTGVGRLVLPSLTGGCSTKKQNGFSSSKLTHRPKGSKDLAGSKSRHDKFTARSEDTSRMYREPSPEASRSFDELDCRTNVRRSSSRPPKCFAKDNTVEDKSQDNIDKRSPKKPRKVDGELSASEAGSAAGVTDAPPKSTAETTSYALGRQQSVSHAGYIDDTEPDCSTSGGQADDACTNVEIVSPKAEPGTAKDETVGEEKSPPTKRISPNDWGDARVVTNSDNDSDNDVGSARQEMEKKRLHELNGIHELGGNLRETQPGVGQCDADESSGQTSRMPTNDAAEVRDNSGEYDGDEFGDDETETPDETEQDAPHDDGDDDDDEDYDDEEEDHQVQTTPPERTREKIPEEGPTDINSNRLVDHQVEGSNESDESHGELGPDDKESAIPAEKPGAVVGKREAGGVTGSNATDPPRRHSSGVLPRVGRAAATEDSNSLEDCSPSDVSIDTAEDDFEEDFEEDGEGPDGGAVILDIDSPDEPRGRTTDDELQDPGGEKQPIRSSRVSTASDGSYGTEGSYSDFDKESDNDASGGKTQVDREFRLYARGKADINEGGVNEARKDFGDAFLGENAVSPDPGGSHQVESRLPSAAPQRLKDGPARRARERSGGRRESIDRRVEAEDIEQDFESDFEDDV